MGLTLPEGVERVFDLGVGYVLLVAKEMVVELGDGRALHVYDSGASGDGFVVFWHSGTPQSGILPGPLLELPQYQHIRWLSMDRPGYGASTPLPGRRVVSVAGDVAAVADALGVERFAVMGTSGGGPHALACAAMLPERVTAVVCVATLAPFGVDGLDWMAGMGEAGVAELAAAVQGRAALRTYVTTADPDLATVFTPTDLDALSEGPYGEWLATTVKRGMAGGLDGLIDDDLAFVAPWGFDPARITAPMLLVHGGEDRTVPSTHADWLANRCRTAELRLYPDDGHISILDHCAAALDWLAGRNGDDSGGK
jgi:pimeloyl-ACP methyl ester carboxylesterase